MPDEREQRLAEWWCATNGYELREDFPALVAVLTKAERDHLTGALWRVLDDIAPAVGMPLWRERCAAGVRPDTGLPYQDGDPARLTAKAAEQ